MWNDGLEKYGNFRSKEIKEILVKLYGLIYTGAKLPYDDLFHTQSNQIILNPT